MSEVFPQSFILIFFITRTTEKMRSFFFCSCLSTALYLQALNSIYWCTQASTEWATYVTDQFLLPYSPIQIFYLSVLFKKYTNVDLDVGFKLV